MLIVILASSCYAYFFFLVSPWASEKQIHISGLRQDIKVKKGKSRMLIVNWLFFFWFLFLPNSNSFYMFLLVLSCFFRWRKQIFQTQRRRVFLFFRTRNARKKRRLSFILWLALAWWALRLASVCWALARNKAKVRHLKTLSDGPTDLIPLISSNITALTDCPFMCRSFRALSTAW